MPPTANPDEAAEGSALASRSTVRRTRKPRAKLRDPAVVEAFWAQVYKGGPPIPRASWLGPCWPWQGRTTQGYGAFYIQRRHWRAHRYSYTLEYGPPVFASIDHLCHTYNLACLGGERCPHRLCVNPLHLESVSSQENARRQQHRTPYNQASLKPAAYPECFNGHKWRMSLAMYDSTGKRICGDCVEGMYDPPSGGSWADLPRR